MILPVFGALPPTPDLRRFLPLLKAAGNRGLFSWWALRLECPRAERRHSASSRPPGDPFGGASPAGTGSIALRSMAQRRRNLPLRHDAPKAASRHLPFVGRPAGGHQSLPRRAQCRPQAFRLDRHTGQRHGQTAACECVSALGCGSRYMPQFIWSDGLSDDIDRRKKLVHSRARTGEA